jgi:hypothetical protein
VIALVAIVTHLTFLGSIDPVLRDGFDADACAPERQQVSDIEYFNGTIENVDITVFDNIWGRSRINDPPMPFPATSTAATILDFDKMAFVAARLAMKPFTPDIYSGAFVYSTSNAPGSPNIDFSISTGCGDFSPSLGQCVAFNAAPKIFALVGWTLFENDSFPTCVLNIDREYFINVRASDPSAPAPACFGDVCAVEIWSEVAVP